MNYTRKSAVIVFMLASSAWSGDSPAKKDSDHVALQVAKDANMFATDLYHRLHADRQDNVFFSPYSISSALAMTYVGANGPTKTQMAQVLHFPQQEQLLNTGFAALREELITGGEKKGFQLRVANRLWGQDGFEFLPEFVQAMQVSYGADVGRLDFKNSEAARQAINSWVDEQTEHKIQNLIAPGVLNALTRLVLTNAIYFKAPWSHKFDKNLTRDTPFHVTNSLDVEVPTMQQTGRFRYAETDRIQILELPYGQNSNVTMLIILPKKNDGLKDLEQQLKAESLEQWTANLRSALVDVNLPKFKLTSEFDLTAVLQSMGMPLAFSRQADFSRMSSQEPLTISAVIHKAFVDVHEEGTEAAAATAVAMRLMALPPTDQKEPIKFQADHPFTFLIRHVPTNSVLFLGRLVNPKDQ